MDYAVCLFSGEKGIEERPVPDVALIELYRGVYGLAVAGGQIVRHDDVKPLGYELVNCVGADVAGSAEHENRHFLTIPFVFFRRGQRSFSLFTILKRVMNSIFMSKTGLQFSM